MKSENAVEAILIDCWERARSVYRASGGRPRTTHLTFFDILAARFPNRRSVIHPCGDGMILVRTHRSYFAVPHCEARIVTDEHSPPSVIERYYMLPPEIQVSVSWRLERLARLSQLARPVYKTPDKAITKGIICFSP